MNPEDLLSECALVISELLLHVRMETGKECLIGASPDPGYCPCVMCRAQDALDRVRKASQ